MGLKAGGITGNIVKIIQAGFAPVPTKFSKIRILLIACSLNLYNRCCSHFLNHCENS